jgi:putative flippase GtrA
MIRGVDIRQFCKYAVNGLAATAVHFGTLTLLVEVVGVTSKGAANVAASLTGILASFLGNRLFVFAASTGSMKGHLARFVALYLFLALLNGFLMGLWSDLLGLDYRLGFVLISCVQLILSFFGNRMLVFK